MNNKGFTFVEILAVIVLIGVLSSIAIVGVTRYKDKARDADYEALAKSSYNGMEEYMMAHPYSKTVSLEALEDGSFISNRKDPATKNTDCTGSVEVNKSSGTGGKLDDGSFVVYLCCTNYKKKYTYPGGTVENYTGTEKCNAAPEEDPDVPTPPTPPPSDLTIRCFSGTYLPKNTTSCRLCISAYYCPGGSFKKKSIDQGLNPCPSGYKNSATGSKTISSCFMRVPTNKYVKKAKDSNPTNCPKGQNKIAHNVYYGKISSCTNKTVTVTFNCNGGTKTSGPSASVYKSDALGQRFTTKCRYDGKIQDGWKKDRNGKTKNYETNSGVSESFVISYTPKITLYAHWVDETYKCSAGTYLRKASKTCTKCLANYYCPGGVFKLNRDKDQGINKCSTNAVGYAYSNEGSDAINDCFMNVPQNKYIRVAKDKTPTNCPSGTYKNAHKVNYGKISSCSNKTIEVTFNCNGGSGGGKQTFTSNVSGQKFNVKCNPIQCKVQDGWKRDKNGSAKNYETNSGVTENFVLTYSPKLTLYAHWKVQSIKCNAGYYLKKGATTCTKCESGYYCPGSTFNCSTSADQGRNACPNGYRNSPAGSTRNTQCYMNVPTNRYVRTARASTHTACESGQNRAAHTVNYGNTSSCNWITYTISYNLNGGVNPGNPSTYRANTPTITLKKPTRSGYDFTGWTGSNGGTPQKTVTIPRGSTGNKYYTAHWVAANITVTVTFKPNGASGNDIDRTCTYKSDAAVKSCSITSPGISRSGWNIIGWNTGNNSTSSAWNVNTTKTVSSNATYYAVTSKQISASFNYKIDNYHNINVLTGASRNTTRSCTLYNANTSCSVTTPGCSFGKSNHKKGNQFDLNKYFICKWGTTPAGSAMNITSGATYTINVTPNTQAHSKITALSEKGVNEVCSRNDKTRLYTYGIHKKTKYGHIDDYHKMTWDGDWIVDSKNHLLWLHGKSEQKETVCTQVKDAKFCKKSKKAICTCWISARLTYTT